jgi:4'-phosphopantetheinyl transferase
VSLDAPPEEVARLGAALAPDEEARAAAFSFDLHRRRFVLARAALRSILARYVPIAPRELQFVYGPAGKPSLSLDSLLHFNLSHSEALAVVAVTRVGRLGIDLEKIRPRPRDDLESLARAFLSPGERERFRALPAGSKPRALTECWTLKEAFLKALGTGFSRSLESLDVWLTPEESVRTLSFREDSGRSSTWSLRRLRPALGYAGALALEGDAAELQCWRWTIG